MKDFEIHVFEVATQYRVLSHGKGETHTWNPTNSLDATRGPLRTFGLEVRTFDDAVKIEDFHLIIGLKPRDDDTKTHEVKALFEFGDDQIRIDLRTWEGSRKEYTDNHPICGMFSSGGNTTVLVIDLIVDEKIVSNLKIPIRVTG